MMDTQASETPMHEHVASFWRLLETEHVRISVDIRRDTGSVIYWDGSSFPDTVAKAIVADRLAVPSPSVPRDGMDDQVYEALTIAAEIVCSMKCPSRWKTSEGRPPHSDECKKVRAARSAWMDHCSYADLQASGGIHD